MVSSTLPAAEAPARRRLILFAATLTTLSANMASSGCGTIFTRRRQALAQRLGNRIELGRKACQRRGRSSVIHLGQQHQTTAAFATSTPTEDLLPAPLMKSPSQWPGMTRSSTSGGRTWMLTISGICPRRCPPSARVCGPWPAHSNRSGSCSQSSCAPQAEVAGTKFCFASEHLTRSKVSHFRFEAARRFPFHWSGDKIALTDHLCLPNLIRITLFVWSNLLKNCQVINLTIFKRYLYVG